MPRVFDGVACESRDASHHWQILEVPPHVACAHADAGVHGVLPHLLLFEDNRKA